MDTIFSEQVFVASFWRRIGAFIIDTLILAVIGYSLAFAFTDIFISFGHWGVFIGFFIAGIYMTFFNSFLAQGQTPGKKLLATRVVKRNGDFLSIIEAFLRYCFLGSLILSQLAILYAWQHSVTLAIVVQATFGIIALTSAYFLIFNNRTRQTVHDFLFDTFVIKIESDPPVNMPKLWKWHIPLALALSLLLLAIPNIIASRFPSHIPKSRISDLQKITLELNKNHDVSFTGIIDGKQFFNNQERTLIVISAHINGKLDKNQYRLLANKLVAQLLKIDPISSDRDIIIVNLLHGYDIGIAKFRRRHTYSYPTTIWKQEIERLSQPSKDSQQL